MKVSYRIKGKDLNKQLRQLFDALGQKGLRRAARRIISRIKRLEFIEYPKATGAPLAKRYRWANGRLSKFKSHKHQKGFFARLNSGKIIIPYNRTRRLSKAPQYSLLLSPTGASINVIVESPKYADMVIGEVQTQYIRTRTHWKPLEKHVIKKQKVIREISEEEIQKILDEAAS